MTRHSSCVDHRHPTHCSDSFLVNDEGVALESVGGIVCIVGDIPEEASLEEAQRLGALLQRWHRLPRQQRLQFLLVLLLSRAATVRGEKGWRPAPPTLPRASQRRLLLSLSLFWRGLC